MRLNRKFAGSAVGVALLAGAGGAWAVANNKSSDDRRRLSQRRRRSPQRRAPKLKDAMKGAFEDRLAADVSRRAPDPEAGRRDQEARRGARRRRRSRPAPGPGAGFGFRFHGPPPPGGHPSRPAAPRCASWPARRAARSTRPPGPIGAGFDAAAKYLGLTQTPAPQAADVRQVAGAGRRGREQGRRRAEEGDRGRREGRARQGRRPTSASPSSRRTTSSRGCTTGSTSS